MEREFIKPSRERILIKVFIQAMSTYVMSIRRLPKTFCSSLSAVVARFSWASNGKQRGMHWKTGDILCSPKDLGGMGFKDFTLLNSTLLSK